MKRFKIFILITIILSAVFSFGLAGRTEAASIFSQNFDYESTGQYSLPYDVSYIGWGNPSGSWMVGQVCMGVYQGGGYMPAALYYNGSYYSGELTSTPGITLTYGNTYTLTFNYRNAGGCISGGNNTYLSIYRGTSQTTQGTLIGQINIKTLSFTQYTVNIPVPSSGTYYIQFLYNNGNDSVVIDTININETIVNNAPTISSISAVPDPVVVGNAVTFTANWADSGDQTRTHICKTNYISGQTCTGGSWCDTASFSGTSPSSCSYTTQSGDVGTNKAYYVFVCDDQNLCSPSSAGNFTVQAISVPSVTTGTSTMIFDRDTNQATLKGTVTSNGGASVTQTRFCWSTSPNISVCGNIIAGNVATNFSGNLTGMAASTTYYYKAQARNSAGWSNLSNTNERAVVIFVADGSQQTFNTCLCTTNTIGGCCDGCNYCPNGKVNNGSGQCVDPSVTYYCGIQNSCTANQCSGDKYYLSCNGSGSCREDTAGAYHQVIYASTGYVFDSSCNNITSSFCGYSGYNKCGGIGSPFSCQKGRDQYRCDGFGLCNTDVGDDWANIPAGSVCSAGSEVSGSASSSCGFSAYNGRSSDKCEKKKDYLACNGSNVCSYGDYGDAYDNVSIYKIANASGQEVDATSEDNTGTCHSCVENECSGYYRWGECNGSGSAVPCTYYQQENVYAETGYTLTSECGTQSTTNCKTNQCRDGSGWHHLCPQRCDAAHSCSFWIDGSCVDHCTNGIKDCDEVQSDCGGSCSPCTPPTTTIQCNGENCSSGWYLSNISVSLICTPAEGTSCAGTYYCIDQTNTCTPETQGISFTFSTEGAINYVRFYSKDNFGSSEVVKSQQIKLDKTAPNSQIISPDVNSNQSVSFDVSIEDTDAGGSGVRACFYMVYDSAIGWTRHSTERTACNSAIQITVGADQDCRTVGGTCTVYVYAYDNAGNSGEANPRSFNIINSDSIRPTTAVISPPDGSWERTDFEFLINDSDAGGSGLAEDCEYMIDDLANDKHTGITTRPCGEFTSDVDVGSLVGDRCSEDRTGIRGEATCKVSTKAYDNAGNNSGWKSRNYRIDYTAPEVGRISCATSPGQVCSIGSGECSSAEQGVEKSFCASLQDPVGRITGCWLYINGEYKKNAVFSPLPCENNADCGVSVNYAFQTSGVHTMRFSCKDAAGNYGWGEPVQVEVITNHAPKINSLRYTTSPCEFPTTEAGCMVNFIVSASDEDGDPLSYSWSFGDSGYSTNQNPSHHYAEINSSPGYNVIVTVSDGRGGTVSRGIVVPVVADQESQCSEGQMKTCGDCSSQACQSDGTWGACTSFGSCSPESCLCPTSRCVGTNYYSYPTHGSCQSSCDCNTGSGFGQPCQATITPNALECTNLSVDLRVSNRNLDIDLINPSNWLNSLNNITVNSSFSVIAIVSGTAEGTINFKFDINGDDLYETTFSNVTSTSSNDPDWIYRQDDQGITRQTKRLVGSVIFIVKNLASYNQSGNHSPKVFIERGTKSAEDNANVGVSSTPPTASVSCNNSQCGPGSSCSPDIAYNRNCAFSYGNESTDSGNDIVRSVWSIFYSDGTPWADPYLSCTDIAGTPSNEALCDLTLPPLTASRSYYISLYVEDGAGSSDNTSRSFYVRREAIANFDCSLNGDGPWGDCGSLNVSANEVVYFQDKSLGSEISGGGTASSSSWYWTFKDGSPSSDTIQSPSSRFEKVDQDSGKVELEITDSAGRGDDFRQQVFPRVPLPGWKEVVPTE